MKSSSSLPALIRLLRPHQWLKNGFVLVGLLFGHAWGQHDKLEQAIAAFIAFCLLSSTVYIFNDLVDREQDRLHPKKKHRPLASGKVTVQTALVLLAGCLATGLLIAFNWAGQASWIFVAYLVLNLAYTLYLKHVVILDVFIISAGFMLRLLAGTLGIGVPPSQWLLLCGLMLTLFLGFAKRRSELAALREGSGGQHRRVLEHYSAPLLDQLITVATAGTVVSYSLYTVSAETVALHGSALWVTVPFVLYGLFRYLFLLHQRSGGGDAAQALLTDKHLILAVAGWLLTTLAMLGAWR